MDFPALPRRDLQALCKRNGIRANMTNAAMTDALRALTTIDGIEEYVKQPVAVPEPAASKEEEPKLEKQASPLPRARRVTAKASKPSKPSEASEVNTTREPNKEEAPAVGVGRRGASRRARTDAVVPKPMGKASTEEEKQGSQLASASRVEDGEAEEDLKREANKENAPAPVVERRGPSRRARPASAIESAGAEAGEEQRQKEGSQAPRGRRVAVKPSEPIRPDDCDREMEKESLNREARTDAAPIHGVGRRGPSRRTRPAPAAVAPAGKVLTEEQTAPIPRGRHVKVKSTESIKPNDCEEDEKDGTKLNEEEADVPSLGVGRRGASRCARRAPAVASIPRSHGVKVKSPEIINLDDSDEEEKEDTKPEKDEGAPAIGVGGRGASRRAPALVEAPATRRMVAASKSEAGDVVAEAVPIRSTRQRKPTMKAAAAAEDKAPRKGTRRGLVKNIISQRKEQEKPQDAISDAEVVPTPVSNVDCNNQEDSEEVVPAPQAEPDVISDGDVGCDNIEDSADAPKQEDKEISDVVTIDGEMLMVQSPAEEPRVTDQECMDEPTLQEQQVNFEKYPARLDIQEDSPILGLVSIATGDAAAVEKGDNLTDIEGSSEGLLNKRVCKEFHGADIEMEILPFTAEEYTAEVVTGDAVNENEVGDLSEVLHIRDEIGEVDTEDGVCQEKESMDCDELQTELVDDAVFPDCSGNISLVDEEKANEENTEDGLGCQEKGDVVADMVVPDMADEAIHLDCSDKNSKVVEEVVKVEEITSETAFCTDACDAGKQNEVSSLENIWEVTVEDGDVSLKTAMSTKDMPQSASVVDEDDEEAHYKTEIHTDQQKKVVTAENEPDADDGIFRENDVLATAAEDINTNLVYAGKQKELVADDNVPEQACTDHVVVVKEKAATMDEEVEQNQFQAVSADQIVTANNVSEVKMTGSEVVEEEAALIIDELQQSTITMNKELTGTDGEVVEEDNAVVVTEEVPYSTCTVDEDIKEDQLQTVLVHADQVVTADNAPELKMTDCEVVEEKGVLIIDEKQQSKVEMDEDVVDDHLKTDAVHALEQKKVVSTDEVPNLTGTDGEVVITEEVPQSTGAMDECVQENHFENTDSLFTQNGEQNTAVTTDSVQEVTGADWDAKNTFTGDFPQELNVAEESNEQITPALLGNATESMSKSIITVESTLYLAEDTSVCKNSSEKNITESLVMKEEQKSKVAKKSEDLTKLSLNQLRIKLKEKLKAKENKEGKRVALARVDGNVCRSHTKEQQPNLNLQQH